MKSGLLYGIAILLLWIVYGAFKKGDTGAPGSRILSGTGVPAATQGAVDDYYLDKTTGALFGPKTAEGWGKATALAGQKGATGPIRQTAATAHTADKKPGYH